MLDICFDFESRASAVLRLKFRGPKANLSLPKSRNISNFGRESQKLVEKVETYRFLVEKVER